MNVSPTAGVAAAWSAAKTSPNDHAVQLAKSKPQTKEGQAPQEAPEPRKRPPAPEGQGTRLDVQV